MIYNRNSNLSHLGMLQLPLALITCHLIMIGCLGKGMRESSTTKSIAILFSLGLRSRKNLAYTVQSHC